METQTSIRISQVIKRDGRIASFDAERIGNAIKKAMISSNRFNEKLFKEILNHVLGLLSSKFSERETPHVEEIQDVVELALVKFGLYEVAKAYILYRKERERIREEVGKILGGRFTKMYKVLSLNALRVLAGRYLLHDLDGNVKETPEEMFDRVARALAEVERGYGRNEADVENFHASFREVMTNLEFLPAGRTLANAGGPTRVVSNCIVLHLEDSMEGIFETLRDASLLQQAGSGLGFPFHLLRPAGSTAVRSRGVASGPVSFLKVYNTAFGVIKQQGRHGANMAVMSVKHPDILEFIHCKAKEGEVRNFNISVGVTDDFMEKVMNDDPTPWMGEWDETETFPRRIKRDQHGVVTSISEEKLSARELMEEIVSSAWSNGEPGVVFLDTVNKHNPLPSLGRIEACNPCISGDALVPTEYGLISIEKIAQDFPHGGMDVVADLRVNHDEFGSTKLKILGASLNTIEKAWMSGTKQTYRLITRAGFELIATLDHKIMTNEGWVQLGSLVPGRHRVLIQSGGCFSKIRKLPFDVEAFDRIGKKIFNLPSEWSQELGQVVGWLIGNGWIREGVHFGFAPEDQDAKTHLKPIIERFYGGSTRETERENRMTYLSYQADGFAEFFKALGVKQTDAKGKEVPRLIFTAPEDAVRGFLQGLYSSDGTINFVDQKSSYIRLSSSSQKLLKQVQLLLLNFGIFSKVYYRVEDGEPRFFDTDKKGNKKEYTAEDYYELEISKDNVLRFLVKIGFIGSKFNAKIKRLQSKTYYSTYFEDHIKLIEPYGTIAVYDLTEPATHSFVANGIVISNCGEQFLHDGDVCNLGSINLQKFVTYGKIDWDRLRFVVRTAARMLDNVIDLTDFPVEKVNRVFRSNRRIGLGLMGFADMLMKLKVPYNSENGLLMAEKVMSFIQENARKMSEELAEEKGVFPNWQHSIFAKEGVRLRNAALTSIAPTGSISMICDVSSGIEPYFALVYVKSQVMGGQNLYYVNKHLERELKERNLYSEELMKKIAHTGSIQNIEEIPKEIRDLFVVALDISPQDHAKMQAAFQRHTDNSISKTCNFPSNATKEDVLEAYILAWQLGCRGLTVYRSLSRKVEVLHLVKHQKREERIPLDVSNPVALLDYGESTTESEAYFEYEKCPDCKGLTIVYQEGCLKCLDCGWSSCVIN